MSDWYVTYYGEQYADSVRDLLTPERGAADVAFVLRETGLQPPAAIADVPCGEGRHARLFAAGGFTVTALDQNETFLARAREGAPPGVTFVRGDMRETVGGPYQLVAVLYHSFGFFDDADNRRVLRQWTGRLAPGGWLVLDVWNRDSIIRLLATNGPSRTWTTSAGLEVREDYAFDPLTSRLGIHYTYTYPHGRCHEYDASHRLYTYTELRDLLAGCGLAIRSAYGSLSGDPYTLDARRLVLFAQRG